MNGEKPDLVCFSDGMVMCRADWRLDCAKAGIPYVNLSQANNEGFWPSDHDVPSWRQALRGARACFFVSQANLELCERQIAERLPHAEVARNPFQVPWSQSPSWPSDAHGGLRVACLGRLEPSSKGQDLLLQVLALPKWKERSLHVNFYGKGYAADSVKSLARFLGVDTKVEFCGFAGDVEKIWREHQLLVLPSRYEGLPLALVEAMLCHRPAVVTNVGGSAEVVEDGVTGFLAPTPTVGDLDRAMERAWERRGELRQMGIRAGEAIRRLVPPDPAAVFADRLLSLAARKGTG